MSTATSPVVLSDVRPSAVGQRYTLTAQALHWVTAILMFSVLPLAWVMVNMPRTAPLRDWLYTLHKSIGLTILALVAFRLAWRAAHPAPPLPVHLARWEALAARASHWLLYLVMIGMPISGYLLSASAGHSTTYFDLFTLPAPPANKELRGVTLWLHVVTGQWLVYALIVLHLGATAWHVAVRRDRVLERMMPEPEPEPGAQA